MYIKINNKNFLVKKNISFWKNFKNKDWESINFKIFKYFINKNTTYYDIGAWIGPTIFTAASFCPKKIYGFEPDIKAYKELKENIFLNKNKFQRKLIKIYNKAGYLYNKKIKLNIPKGEYGSSLSSLLKSRKIYYESSIVNCVNLLNFFKNTGLCKNDFIKIDIEGGEYKLLPFIGNLLREKLPNIYLSLHPFLIDNFFEKILENNKLLFSLRGYKYVYRVKKNLIFTSKWLSFFLRFRIPILWTVRHSLIFTNKEII
jgi:FkbM family methyltransferase